MVNVQAQSVVKSVSSEGFSWINDNLNVNATWYSTSNCTTIVTGNGANNKTTICADGGGSELSMQDDKRVKSELNSDKSRTNYLLIRNFKITFPEDPESITISSIEVSFTKYGEKGGGGGPNSGTGLYDHEVRLIKNGEMNRTGSNPFEANKAKPATSANEWSSSEKVATYGGPADPYPLWGTTWTPADITSSNFGVAISAQKSSGNNSVTAYIGMVSVKVNYTYTPPTPLPVELMKFTARYQNGQVIVDWATASEESNDYFTIERSADGAGFEALATIKGAGDTRNVQEYQFRDSKYMPGTSYYRLKQTDFDGSFTYSNVVSVTAAKRKGSILIFPNPSDGQFLNISATESIQEQVELSIYNSAGIKVGQQNMQNLGITPVTVFHDKVLKPGVYLLLLNAGGEQQRQNFVVY
ncbi:MAG: T9SS type A sorting domain-containing protein [Hymenobacteraceae bacterium]|nr:T9SS type A sorting domain-containing protein [Hymenobacteraceae bacterium]MDX5395206.1 T9SS type A sorting domain-containing protein [Hymenobacteraceae bacterium]MDX5443737.1 T9SS type A sorting domain-containing protein [Hymenobacteraceae bacterium]MDX5511244.1 T9SS type A sorting domain-containing protein [Hymenobacteraceae bacterium]